MGLFSGPDGGGQSAGQLTIGVTSQAHVKLYVPYSETVTLTFSVKISGVNVTSIGNTGGTSS